jgi:hypothetical protein
VQFYRITPLALQGIKYRFELTDGQRLWSVSELWNKGQGFRILDEYIEEIEPVTVVCNPAIGWGPGLDQIQEVQFDFESLTEQEKSEIRNQWQNPIQARTWITQSNWSVVKELITIFSPMKIELVGQPIGSLLRDAGRILERHRKGLL